MNNVIDWPIKVAPQKPRQPYKGPRINRKNRRLALNSLLDNFDTRGLYGLVIIGLPYARDVPYPYDAAGGEGHEYMEALEAVRDTVKGVLIIGDMEDEEEE